MTHQLVSTIVHIARVLRRDGISFLPFRTLVFLQRLAGHHAAVFFRIAGGKGPTMLDLAAEEYSPGTSLNLPMPWSSELISARRSQGHRLFLLRVDGRAVSFAWVME